MWAGWVLPHDTEMVLLADLVSDDETAVEAAALVGNVVLVLRSGSTLRSEARALVEILHRRKINILGTLVVDVPEHYLEHARSRSRRGGLGTRNQKERTIRASGMEIGYTGGWIMKLLPFHGPGSCLGPT